MLESHFKHYSLNMPVAREVPQGLQCGLRLALAPTWNFHAACPGLKNHQNCDFCRLAQTQQFKQAAMWRILDILHRQSWGPSCCLAHRHVHEAHLMNVLCQVYPSKADIENCSLLCIFTCQLNVSVFVCVFGNSKATSTYPVHGRQKGICSNVDP